MLFSRLLPLFLVFTLLIAPAPTAVADDVAKQKLVIEIFKVMRYDRLIDQMTEISDRQAVLILKQKNTVVDAEVLQVVKQLTEEEFRKLAPDMARLTGVFMSRNFSEDELRAMLAFYRTPTGQKTMAIMPRMMDEIMPYFRPILERAKTNLIAKLKARLAEKGYQM